MSIDLTERAPPTFDDAATAPAEDSTPTLSVDDFHRVGRAIGNNRGNWQATLGDRLVYSKSMMSRWGSGTRKPSPQLVSGMRRVVLERIIELAEVIDTPGLPNPDAGLTQREKATIISAAQRLIDADQTYDQYFEGG